MNGKPNHMHHAHEFAARDISISYGATPVVHNMSLSIPAHQMGVIIGPNGCGKSTLLSAFARLVKPAEGQIILDGKSINTLPTRQVATRVGLLPQNPTTPEGITVMDLIERGRHPYHRMLDGWNDEDRESVSHALEVTGLHDLADRPVDQLSGGQRQRAWIALTLAQETDILLLDEPTTFLDIAYQLEVLDLLSHLNATEGLTVVMVLHDLNLAARYADWMLAMDHGRMVSLGTPQEVVTQEMVESVFGVKSNVEYDALGNPVMTPIMNYSLRQRRNEVQEMM